MKRLLLIFFIGLVTSCALQVAPSGGPKDMEPPLIRSEEPVSGTTSFQENEIRIGFQEFVKLNRLKEQLVVSPPLRYNLSAQVRGKELRIKIKDTLKESTTYVFNFGNSIVDLHENNPIENYTYVLSTGPRIDSGRIGGKVSLAFEADPAAKVTIMAYNTDKENLDSLPYLEKPDYVAKTNEEGKFQLEYMKEGSYKIFALLDENSNYLFDKKTEQIAFLEDWVHTSEKIDSLGLFLFKEDHEIQFVKEQIEQGPATQLIFNLDVDSFHYSTELVDSLNLTPLLTDYQLPNDSILFWWPERKLRFPLIIQADTLRDTLKIAIDTIVNNIKGKRSLLSIQSFGAHHYYSAPTIKFSYPIDSVNTNLITLINSDSVEIPFELKKGRWANELILKYDREEAMSYVFTADSAAFTDIYAHHNDSMSYPFKLDEEDDYGSLKVDINSNYKGPFVLQLTTAKRKFIKEVALREPSYTFEHMSSGTFSLKLIYDANGNGMWDTGNYLKGNQPEKVVNYQGEIRIRNRWIKEIEWIIME